MKRIMLIVSLALIMSEMVASELVPALSVLTKDGKRNVFLLKENPTLSFDGDEVELNTTSTSLLFDFDELSKFAIIEVEENSTSIEEVDQPAMKYKLEDGQISVTNMPQGVNLSVYAPDGRLLLQARPDAQGTATLSTGSNLPKIIIVKAGSLTTKIVRR